jgi:hypothetical protein
MRREDIEINYLIVNGSICSKEKISFCIMLPPVPVRFGVFEKENGFSHILDLECQVQF